MKKIPYGMEEIGSYYQKGMQHLFCMQPWEKEDFLQLTK